jgi:acetyl esterase/lipase
MARARLIFNILFTRGQTHRYGSHRSQLADLHLPSGSRAGGGPYPVMILLHGGSWQKRYGRIVMRGLVRDLLKRGWAVWNIEYRRLGEGGGWPMTFADVAAAIDQLSELGDARLDLSRVNILGHSAGGHLALWAAGREKLPPDAPGAVAGPPRVRLKRAISQAGVCDLAGGYRDWGGGALKALMGGSPEELPERYAAADPLANVPLDIPVLIVHGVLDATVSIELSRRYTRAAGGAVELVEIDGEAGAHRAHIDPRGEAWRAVTGWLRRPLRASA